MLPKLGKAWLLIINPFIILFLTVAVLFRYYLYQIGPDAISYISIAENYRAGRWSEAINSHWSPMFSWLLAALLAVGIPIFPALKVLAAASGAFTLYAVIRWTQSMGLLTASRTTVEAAAAVIIGSYALLQAGPDLLLAGLLLLYLWHASGSRYDTERGEGVTCGVIAAIGYLTKAYFFVFFVAHFLTLLLLRLLLGPKEVRSLQLKKSAAGFAAFLVLSGAWILLISQREGRFTISAHSEFSYRIRGPASNGYPQFGRMIPPPGEHATSMWEAADPSLLPPWHFYDSPGALLHQIRLVAVNSKELLLLLRESSLFAAGLLLGYFLLAASGRGSPDYPLPFIASALAIYPLAYLLVVVQDRYFSGWLLLVMVLGFFVVNTICRSSVITAGASRTLVAAVFISFLVLPLHSLANARNGGRNLYDLSQTVLRQGRIRRGNMASCARWNDSLLLAFFLNMRFYGTTGMAENEIVGNLSGTVNRRSLAAGGADPGPQLAANHIDYYSVWDDCPAVPSYIRKMPDVTNGKARGIHIYDVSGL